MSVRLRATKKTNLYASVVKEAGKFAEHIMSDSADFGIGEAKKRYSEAEYDGETDSINIYIRKQKNGVWWLVAEGPQVEAIEHGSGDFSDSTTRGPKVLYKKETGEAFWFFITTADTRFTSGTGEYKTLKPEKVIKRYENVLKKGNVWARKLVGHYETPKQFSKDFEAVKDDYKDYDEWYRERENEDSAYLKKGWESAKRIEDRYTNDRNEAEREVDETYGYTRGNEPQHVMQDVGDEIRKHIAKEYGGH